MSARANWWNIAYLFAIGLGIPAATYHLINERYANAVMATGAVVIGFVVLLAQRRAGESFGTPQPETGNGPRIRQMPSLFADDSPPAPRGTVESRVSGAILAGFVATILLTLALIPSYVLAAIIGQEDGNQLQRWFWNLTHNTITDGVLDIPVVTFGVNIAAGLAWAFIYAFIFEPRMRGYSWLKGALFSIVPWILSLVVFFPLIDAGFFGMDLDAGPLPILGNLALHLVYGVSLGTMYAIPEVSLTADAVDDARIAKWENDGIAAGLILGLVAGLVVGALLAVFVSTDAYGPTGIILASGALGTAVGGVAGPLFGLDWGERHTSHG